MHYPIYRLVRAAARRPLDELFDDLAQHAGLTAQRLGEGSLLLDGPGVLVSARGRRKTDYSSMTFAIWADSLVSLESIRDRLLGTAGRDQIRHARVHLPGGRRRARCSYRSGSGNKARRHDGELDSIISRPYAHAAPIRKPDRSGRPGRAGRADCARRWPPWP